MVQRNNNYFIKFFLFQLLLFESQTITQINYDYEKEFIEKKIEQVKKEQNYELVFDKQNQIPNYIKVTIIPKDNIPTPLLCFSSSDSNCIFDRENIVKRTDGRPSKLYVKKEQFEDKYFYILVTCKEDDCSYTLKFEGEEFASINLNETYSYLVTNNNKEMIFKINEKVENDSYLTLGIDGYSDYAEFDIEDCDGPQFFFETGRVVICPFISENSSFFTKIIINDQNAGDYLTLSLHIVKNGFADDNLLYPNGPNIMGLISDHNKECFPLNSLISEKYSDIKNFYLTGKIYSKHGLVFITDENHNIIKGTEEEIYDGFLSSLIEINSKMKFICLGSLNKSTIEKGFVAYSISILEPINLEPFYKYYLPQNLGQNYRRIIRKGDIAFFHTGKIAPNDKKITFNMYNRKGVSEMYIAKCEKFPNCLYSKDELTNMIKPKKINKMAIWENSINTTYDALSSSKDVMVVFCRDDDNENKGYCEVEISSFIPGQDITLVENEKFSKFVLKNEAGKFKMKFEGIKIQRLTISIMIYSGDVIFDIEENFSKFNSNNLHYEEIKLYYNKYYLSNKIYYHFNFAQLEYESITLKYKGEQNSFFSVQYEIDSFNLIKLEENVHSGESYLVEIDPSTNEKYKIIYLENNRYKKEQPFLANFFALNCQYQIIRGEKEIPFFNGYAQEIILKNDNKYKSQNYEYKIKIIEEDLLNYNNKMCMIYIEGYESKDNETEREILISDNINQQFILNDNFKTIRLLYPHSNYLNPLGVFINVIDKAIYDIDIFINNENSPLEYRISKSQIIYIYPKNITDFCKENSLCNIIIQITLNKNICNNTFNNGSMVEINIRQINNSMSYLKNHQSKTDYICSDNSYYLYTDIGKNDRGYILVNFFRYYGEVYGKIIKKEFDKENDEADTNWRGIYSMPLDDLLNNSLLYVGNTKKIEISVKDTQECIDGCYLLLSIGISKIGDYIFESKFFPFWIISNIISSNYLDYPIINIKLDELIFGNVDISEDGQIIQFYKIYLPYDSSSVEFDWQTELAELYINIRELKPSINNYDFRLVPSGRQTVLFLDKNEILEKAKENKINLPYENSLKNLILTIGIWTDKKDSFETENYCLRIHMPKDLIDIIEINTDQKFLCRPKYLGEFEYRCLFMIKYDKEDALLKVPLLIHSVSTNKKALTYIYADFIEGKYYDEYDINYLEEKIPDSKTSQYNSNKMDEDFIYIELNENNAKYYLFVSIISNILDDIMIITYLPPNYLMNYSSYLELNPNPFSEQLLSLSGDNLMLNFFSSSSLIINIVVLNGEAKIFWDNYPNEIYNLRGRGDRLSLTSGENINKKLIINPIKKSINNLSSLESGFIFYISYYTRNYKINVDKIPIGESIEIGYKKVELPINLYCKLENYNMDYNIAITFKDINIDVNGEFQNPPLNIYIFILKENTIYKLKENSDLSPLLDLGINAKYDIALGTSLISLSKNIIKDLNIEDNPNIYLSIHENDNSTKKKYDKFIIGIKIHELNDTNFLSENVYHFEKYSGKDTFYRLKINKKKPYIKCEISFNNEYLDFSINTEIGRLNRTDIIKDSQKLGGKLILFIENPSNSDFLFLNIFRTDKNIYNQIFLNYVFKYNNIESSDVFIKYKILNNNNELIIDEGKEENIDIIKCTFNKIDVKKDKVNITYFLKVIDNDNYIREESLETISFTESPYYAVYSKNPIDNNGNITLIAKGNFNNIFYLQVIAQIQEQDNNLIYLSYKGLKYIRYNPEPEEEEEEKEEEKEEEEEEEEEKEEGIDKKENSSDDKIYIIVISIIGGIIFILTVFIIFHICRRRRFNNTIDIKDIGVLEPRQMNEQLIPD